MHREIVNDRLKLMYHRLVVRRLAHDSSLIDDARKVVAQWQTQPKRKTFVGEWESVLSQPPDASAGLFRPAHRMRLVYASVHLSHMSSG
jgi:hypothetical protein